VGFRRLDGGRAALDAGLKAKAYSYGWLSESGVVQEAALEAEATLRILR
jgi:hypothetical protein